jgi:hypothetical protein
MDGFAVQLAKSRYFGQYVRQPCREQNHPRLDAFRSIQRRNENALAPLDSYHQGTLKFYAFVPFQLSSADLQELRWGRIIARQESVKGLGPLVPGVSGIKDGNASHASSEQQCSAQSGGAASDNDDVMRPGFWFVVHG